MQTQGLQNSQQMRQGQTLSQVMLRNLSLLQAPAVELRREIIAAAERNPALELTAENPLELSESEVRRREEVRDGEEHEGRDDERDYFLQRMENAPDMEDIQARRKHFFDSVQVEESLQEHLFSQIACASFDERDTRLAEILIGNINEDGYFVGSLPDIEMIEERSEREVLKVLEKIRDEFDPPGVGARTLSECLLSQLRDAPDTLEVRTAREIIANDLEAFASRKDAALCVKYGLTEQKLGEVRTLIKTLDPRPGRLFDARGGLYLVPEVEVFRRKDGSFAARTVDRFLPTVKINPFYRDMAKSEKVDKTERDYLRNCLRDANAFLEGLSMREKTLQAIAQAMVELQPEFWTEGFAALKPMTMAEVAERAGVHETTVSRTVAEKYLRSARGVFPMRSFFSAALAREDGASVSSRAVKERIEALIKAEDRANPLSDETIAQMLKKEGVVCARRTVMKYRMALKIPSSRERKA